MLPRRRAGSPSAPPNPTRRRQSITPISNPEPAMAVDISLLQERGGDRGQISRFHARSPAAIAQAPGPVSRVTPITLVSNSHGFPETELSDEEELQHSVVPSPQETVPQPLPLPARCDIVPWGVDEKGNEPEEALKQICGICLLEDQRTTLQGLLNCCSHYFCFTCILEWSKAESRCPLCKRRFNTITVEDAGSGLRSTAISVEKHDQNAIGSGHWFVRSGEVANAKDQLIPIVKKSLEHICSQSPLDASAFMNVARAARRAINTILALYGFGHNSNMVVAIPFPLPSHCSHARDGQEPTFLMRTICLPCFESFVGDVIRHIANSSPEVDNSGGAQRHQAHH